MSLNESSTSPFKTRSVLAPILLVAALMAWLGFNLIKLSERASSGDGAAVAFPEPRYGRAYSEYIAPVISEEAEFVIYQQIKRHFRGWRLVGSSRDALYFAPLYDLEYNGPMISTLVTYDPDLTPEETRVFAGQIIGRRTRGPNTSLGVVPPAPGTAPDTVVVLRGSDGMYIFVAVAMAPARFARLGYDR
jgi:hypothetical protein